MVGTLIMIWVKSNEDRLTSQMRAHFFFEPRGISPHIMMHIYLYIFHQEVLAFQQDPSHEVRKLVVSFVEEAW